MSSALAIFVKTPGLSKCKTRLKVGLGSDKTKEFYLNCLSIANSLLHDLTESTKINLTPYWSVAESTGLNNSLWDDHQKVFQGEGDLGNRLNRVYQQLIKDHDVVYFMGADSPHLESAKIERFMSEFESSSHDFCLAPTTDGGFYLFGGKKEIPNIILEDVNYSRSTTFLELKSNLISIGSVQELEASFDIDTIEDLSRLSEVSTESLQGKRKFLQKWMLETL